MIVVVPAETAVTVPDELEAREPTATVLLLHVPPAVPSVKVVVLPIPHIVAVPLMLPGAAKTVTTVVAVILPQVLVAV